VGVLTVLAFSQLQPELLAAEYPLRFMNLYYCYTVVFVSLIFDFIGVGHCGWAVYFLSRRLCCAGHISTADKHVESSKPELVRVQSAEILAHEMELAKPRSNSFSFSIGNKSSNAVNETQASKL
jgi:hypothetical protein